MPASGLSRVLQGQELSTLRGTVVENNESDSSEKPAVWPPSLEDEKIDVSASRRYGSDKWLPLGRPGSSFTDLLSGFGSQTNSPNDFAINSAEQTVVSANSKKRQLQEHEGKFNFLGSPWSLMPSGLSLNLMDSSVKTHGHGTEISYQMRGDARYGSFNEYPLLPGNRLDSQQANWLMPPPMTTYLQMPPPPSSGEMIHNPVLVQQHNAVKTKEGSCKLFGIPLISNSRPLEPALSHKNGTIESAGQVPLGMHTHPSSAFESDQRSEQLKGSKVVDNVVARNEQERQSQPFNQVTRDKEGKVYGGSTRSCTKVSPTYS